MRPMRPAEAQWYFAESALDRTPSRDDGIELKDELALRKRAIEHIRSLWTRAKGHAADDGMEVVAGKGVLTVGATLLHRFYMRRSFDDFSEQLIAPTILFLASKIEEESLRLRHIVNVTLAKFEPNAEKWEPVADMDIPPSREYKQWERDILATEEVALEALCFDMSVEQPWTVLRRSIRGLDECWLSDEIVNKGEGEDQVAESSAQDEERETRGGIDSQGPGQKQGEVEMKNGGVKRERKGKAKVTESSFTELGWTLINEGCLSPIPILHPPPIFAFSVFVLVLSLTLRIPISEALHASIDLGWRFELDFDPPNIEEPDKIASLPSDLENVKHCINKYVEYCKIDLIDSNLLQHFVRDTADVPTQRRLFQRRNLPDVPTVNGNGTHNGH